jgi:hypothetical protein
MSKKNEGGDQFITFEQMVAMGMIPSLSDLETQLQEVCAEEERLRKLKNDYPDLAKRQNDGGLNAGEYKIWQSIHMLEGVLKRKMDLEETIEGRVKLGY